MAKASNWHDVRTNAVKSGHISESGIARARRTHEAQTRAYRLRQIRESQTRNQMEVARAMNVSQSRVSRLENGDIAHTEVGTLRAYVEALGGELRVVADFGDEQLAVG